MGGKAEDQGPWVDSDEDEATTKEEATNEETNEEEGEEEVEESKEEKGKFVPKNLPEDEEWEFVEIKDPAIQRKFNRVYAQVKHNERTNRQLLDDNRKLAETKKELADRLAALESKFADKEYTDSKASLESKLTSLTKERTAAINDGDDERAYAITEEIIEIKRELKAPKPEREKPKEPTVQKEETKEEEFQFSDEDKEALAQWGFEKDKRGNLLRPWFDASHPDHIMAKKMAEGILEEVGDVPVNVQEVLEELDRRMSRYQGKGTTRRAQDVQSTDAPKRGKAHNLSNEQVYIATRMFPDMSKESAIKAYMEGFDDDRSWT